MGDFVLAFATLASDQLLPIGGLRALGGFGRHEGETSSSIDFSTVVVPRPCLYTFLIPVSHVPLTYPVLDKILESPTGPRGLDGASAFLFRNSLRY